MKWGVRPQWVPETSGPQRLVWVTRPQGNFHSAPRGSIHQVLVPSVSEMYPDSCRKLMFSKTHFQADLGDPKLGSGGVLGKDVLSSHTPGPLWVCTQSCDHGLKHRTERSQQVSSLSVVCPTREKSRSGDLVSGTLQRLPHRCHIAGLTPKAPRMQPWTQPRPSLPLLFSGSQMTHTMGWAGHTAMATVILTVPAHMSHRFKVHI